MAKRIVPALLIVLLVCLLTGLVTAKDNETTVAKRKLAIIPLSDVVDWHMLATLKRRLEEAKAWGAQQYVFEINSYGGYLEAIEDISAEVIALNKPGSKTTAFVVNKALSGGAYIALACDEIAMQQGSSIGDVMPILATLQELPEDIKEKFESPVRAKFTEFATKNGYPVALAEAMVSPDIEVIEVVVRGAEGEETHYVKAPDYDEWIRQKEDVEKYAEVSHRTVVRAGQLLTMGATQAKNFGFSKYTVSNREMLLEKLAEAYYTQATGEVKAVPADTVFDVSVFRTNWWEGFVRFLTSPVVQVVLLFVGLLGLYVEFKVPGFGLPGIVGICCIGLVLFGSYAVGLASVIELLLIAAGLILLALEIFVIPGFGVAGISGLILLIVGVLLSFQKGFMPETPFETEVLQTNVVVLVTSFLVFVAAAVLMARYLPRTKQFSKIALEGPEAGTVHGDAAVQARLYELVGKTGMATTTLRPAGKAKIEGRLLDVVTQGDFIEKDVRIRVLRLEGNRIVVVPDSGEMS